MFALFWQLNTAKILLLCHAGISHAGTTVDLLAFMGCCYSAYVFVEFFIQVVIELWKIASITPVIPIRRQFFRFRISWFHQVLSFVIIFCSVALVFPGSEFRLWIKFILFDNLWKLRWSLWRLATFALIVLYFWTIISVNMGWNNMAIIHFSDCDSRTIIVTTFLPLNIFDVYLEFIFV